ncbi:MAG: EFR1 family ferrodoxin [Sphaerochaetaceae bacterium]|nr:EFR1 family ferrodoxin [Sphaerochaetaceae bacterium]HHU88773.1 4Fe-4S dicluster domain-containing protein [Spirochaetales bacterium]
MSSAICYFSGSGNSKVVARDLKERLKYDHLYSIGEVEANREVLEGVKVLGLIYPIYYSGPPAAVVAFLLDTLSNLKLDLDYLFVLHTHGGLPAYGPAFSDLLLSEAGYIAAYNGSIKMVDTYTPLFKIPKKERQVKIHSKIEASLKKIASDLDKQELRLPYRLPFNRLALKFWRPGLGNRGAKDLNFTVSDGCDGCAICQAVCPVNNIKMEEGRPAYLHHCEQCLACYHHCPQRAIRFKKRPLRGYSWYTPPNTFLPKG